jgi:hypothetical protein
MNEQIPTRQWTLDRLAGLAALGGANPLTPKSDQEMVETEVILRQRLAELADRAPTVPRP